MFGFLLVNETVCEFAGVFWAQTEDSPQDLKNCLLFDQSPAHLSVDRVLETVHLVGR